MTNRNARSGFRAGRNQDAVQENIELLTGQRGNGLDRAITVRELAQLGLIGVTRNGAGNVITKPLPPTIPDTDKPVEVPHAPNGFMAYGGFGSIMLEWQLPTFSGFAHAEIWRAAPNIDGSSPNLEQAVLVATTPATVFGDVVDPGSTFYYWCRFVNIKDFAGPYHGVDGVKVSTSQNISDIIDDIGSQMQESELIQGLIDDIAKGDSALQATIDKAKEDLAIADSALQESINTTQQALEAADNSLQGSINSAKDAFDKEIARVEKEYKGADAEANSAIKGIEQAVANTNGAVAELGTQIRTEFKDADKAVQSTITELDKVLSSADQSLAESIKALETEYKDADATLAGIVSELTQVVTDADKALAQKIEKVETEYKSADSSTNAAITALTKTFSDGDKSLAERIDGITSEWEGADSEVLAQANANITEASKALASADQVLAEKLSQIEVDFKASDSELSGAISELSQVVATDDNILAQQISQMDAAFKVTGESMSQTTNAKIKQVQQTSADADRALAQIITQLEASYKEGDKELSGAIIELDKVTAERDKVVSDKVDTVQSAVNGVSATVQQNSTAISEINKDGSTAHKAMWGTKAQAGDIKAGIGILAKSDGTSQVAVSASQFFVFDPNKAGAIQPLFAIDKGNVVIPKALIESATIQILNAQHITADSIVAGVGISSPTITGGKLNGAEINIGAGGWYNHHHFHVNSSGHLYAQNATIHGAVHASSGSFTGTVNANAGTFNNVTINENCTIKGTISANKVSGAFTSAKFISLGEKELPGGWSNVATFSVNSNIVPMLISVINYTVWNKGSNLKVRLRSSTGKSVESALFRAKVSFNNWTAPAITLDVGTSAQTIYFDVYYSGTQDTSRKQNAQNILCLATARSGYFK